MAVITLLGMMAGACTGSTTTSTELLVSSISDEIHEPSISGVEAVGWIESFGANLTSGDLEAASGVWAEKWTRIAVPLSQGTAAIAPPAAILDAVAFLDSWTTLEFSDCEPGDDKQVFIEVLCTATVSGPFPEALQLDPFELPFRFVVTEDGLALMETDFATIQGTSNTWPAEGAFYTYEAFYQYAAQNAEFATDHQTGVGQPKPTVESAAAHIALAEEWINQGSP